MPIKIFIIYLIIINIISILITVSDKHAAKTRKQRIPEAALLFLSLIGGGIGMFFTMQIARHKTRKAKFMLGIPLIIVIELIFLLLFVKKYGIF